MAHWRGVAWGVVAVLLVTAQSAVSADNRVLVIGTKEAPPFVMKDNDGVWSGISIDLWRHVAEQLDLRYRFKETTLQGLIEGTANGSLDAAVAALTVTSDREQVVDFTQPFYTTGLGIAVPKRAQFDWWRLLRSLVSVGFFEALLALVGVTAAIGLLVWALERRHTEHFGGGVRKGVVSGVWWSALTMTQAGTDREPETAIGRVVAVGWMAASVMAIAVFTAGITSQLTAKQLQGLVHDVDDLRLVRVGAVSGTTTLDSLARERIRYRAYPTVRDGLNALKAGSLDAFVYDRPLLAWLIKEEFSSSLEVLDATFDRQSYAIALPNNSALRLPINLVMLEWIKGDRWRDILFKYLGKE